MRLDRIDIDGFGIFHDAHILDIPPGLSVFYGENEAGKSTLLAFIRYVLFGFPDGRSRENPYHPLRGGSPGGRLTVQSDKGVRYVVERRPGQRGGAVKVTAADGGGDGQALSQLLGFATRDLFRKIFAFSLAELQQFESLDDDTVKTIIYSAGIGTGGVSLPEVQRNLDKSLQELFTPRGKGTKISQTADEIERIQQQLRDKTRNVEAYDELHGKLASLDTQIRDLQERQRQRQRQRERAKEFTRAWEDWWALRSSQQELAELPLIELFPADGLPCLQNSRERLDETDRQIDGLAATLRVTQEEYDRIDVDEQVLAQSETIDRMKQGRDRYDVALSEVESLKQQVKGAEGALAEGLRELGPEWDMARLETFDTSIAQPELVRRFRDEIQSANAKGQDCQNRLNSAAKSVNEAFTAKQQAEEGLAAFPPNLERDSEVLAVRLIKLGNLAARLREKQELGRQLNHLQERESDLQLQKRLVQQASPSVSRILPLWPAAAIFGLLLLFGGFAAIMTQGLKGLLVFFSSLLVAGAAATLYLIVRRQPSRSGSGKPATGESQLPVVEQRLSEIAKEKAAVARKQTDLLELVSLVCAEMKLVPSVDEATVAGMIAETQRAEVAQQRWAAAQTALSKASTVLEVARQDGQKDEEALRQAQAKLDEVRQAWSVWLAAHELRQNLTPDDALAVFAAIKTCREKTKTVKDLQDRLAGANAAVEHYRQQVDKIVLDCGGRERPYEGVAGRLDRLTQRLKTAQGNKQQCDELSRNLARDRAILGQLREKKQEQEHEFEVLLAEGGANNPEEFRERAAIWQRRRDLVGDAQQRLASLERIAASWGEQLDALKEYLSQSTPVEQEALRETAEKELSDIDRAFAEKNEERGSIKRELAVLESEEETARLRMEEQALLTKLQADARQWTLTAIAKQLLASARERYERERQPGVIRDASQFFSRITNGEYPQVLALPEESTLRVLDKNQQLKEMEQLSTGTKEQLYLAVRLGLIREFSQRQEPLPVVMDDIFVNFDPRRAEAAMAAVLDLAQTNQVLLFTCHPETCKLVRDMAKETAFFQLPKDHVTTTVVGSGTM